MDETWILQNVRGADKVIAWFGHWPVFHDAEVLDILLTRSDECVMRVEYALPTRKADENGHTVMEKQAVVIFKLKDITDCELVGFNQQNSISSLEVEHDEEGVSLAWDTSYGVSGWMTGGSLSVEVQPGDQLTEITAVTCGLSKGKFERLFSSQVGSRTYGNVHVIHTKSRELERDLSGIMRGVLFVHAVWSEESIASFKAFCAAMASAGTALTVYVINSDDCDADAYQTTLGELPQGKGEVYWIREGKIIHRDQGYAQGADVVAERLRDYAK